MAYFYTTTATNNWSDATKWFNGTGGTGGSLGHAPTSSDNAIFDANSYNDNYTVTIDATANCADFTMDKPTGVGKKVTWAGSSELNVYGSLTLTGGTAGITRSYTGTLKMKATSGIKTITSNDVSHTNFRMDGVGGTFRLVDNFKEVTGVFALDNGTFDPNGKEVYLGAGTISVGTTPITFYDLKKDETSSKTGTLNLSSNIIVTHLLTILGNSSVNRTIVQSNTIGTQRTITLASGATYSITNADFKDIKIYNTDTSGENIDLSSIIGGSGNCGGSSGITFTTGAPQYWYKASGNDNWSTAGNWYLASGGTGGAGRVPLPQDTAIFDNNSFGSTSMTLTQDMPRIPSTTFKGVDGLHPVGNNPTFTTSTTASFFGDLRLTANMTLTASTQTYTAEGRGNYYLESAGHSWAKRFNITVYGGKITLSDDILTTDQIVFNWGTLDANNKNVTCLNINSGTGTTRSIVMGNGTWTLTGNTSGYAWRPFSGSLNYSLNAGNSTLKFTDTSNTTLIVTLIADLSYHNIYISRGSSTGITRFYYGGTINQLKDDGSVAHTIYFNNGTTTTIADWQVSGTAGNLITVTSDTTGTFNLVKSGGGKVSADYLDVAHSVARPLNVWYAGTHSTNSQATATAGSGWIFTAPPNPSTILTDRGVKRGRRLIRNRFKFTKVSI